MALFAAAAGPPKFSDYPAKPFAGPLRFPSEKHWPDPNWREDSAARVNFGGHFTLLTVSCGIACASSWLVDRRNGRMIRVPVGEPDVQAFSIDTRANSNLMRIVWVSSRNDGSGDIFPPCFRQDYVWTGKAFRALSRRSPAGCPAKVTQ